MKYFFNKMKGLALVVGAGGIGTQLAKDLNESEKDLDVVLCGRKSKFNSFWELDIELSLIHISEPTRPY